MVAPAKEGFKVRKTSADKKKKKVNVTCGSRYIFCSLITNQENLNL